MLDLIIALHEGFDAIPTKLGSEVRPRGQVDDFGSGVIEGGKGLFWGWWDGITGLATEPIAGGKKEGALGVIKGMGRSYVNVSARPAAGVLGMMALPIHGAWKSIRRQSAGQAEKALAKARRDMSNELGKSVSKERVKDHLGRFEELERGTQARKEKMKKRAKLFLMGEETAFDVEDAKLAGAVEEAEKKAKKEGSQRTEQKQGQGEAESQAEEKVAPASDASDEGKDGQRQQQQEQQQQDESQAMGDLAQEVAQSAQTEAAVKPELAAQLEEAEKKGYERALAELKKQQGK